MGIIVFAQAIIHFDMGYACFFLPQIVSILDQHGGIATMDHPREHFQNWHIQIFHVTAMNGFLMP
jgi:hypothetical protein